MNKVTVISSLFYIGRDKWKYSGFPPDVDRYKSWVGNLLRQDINLYFYVDDYYYDFVFEKRKKYDPNFEKTVLIKTSLDNLYFYKKYFNRELCLMSSFDFKQTIFHKDSADMNYPLYNIVNFSKIEFVKTSFEENKFNSDYFFWVDAGGLRNIINEEDRIWLNMEYEGFNTDKITHFTHNLEFNIYNDKSDYFRSQNRNIQGTAWIIPKNKISLFYDLIDNEVNSIITNRIVGSDEKIYDFLYKSNPEIYRLEKCNWFEFYDVCKSKFSNLEKSNRLKTILNSDSLPEMHINYLYKLRDEFGYIPKVIYDVGACVSVWTRDVKKVWPESRFILFEAMEESENIFRENNY